MKILKENVVKDKREKSVVRNNAWSVVVVRTSAS